MAPEDLSATTNINFGNRLKLVNKPEDIPTRWRGTPIEDLFGAHNFRKPIESTGEPKLLVVTCIEYRFRPEVPSAFAYVSRSAGGRMFGSEFSLSYILAKGVRHMALIGHNDCGMTKVEEFRPKLIEALVDQGWDPCRAEDFVGQNAGRYMMKDEIDALKREFMRLRQLVPKMEIAPLFVSLMSQRLHIPKWYVEYLEDEKACGEKRMHPEDLLMI